MRFSDFTFVSHGREFPAHRLVVMTHSSVLEKLIQSGDLVEVNGKCIVQVNTVFSPSTVEHFLEYLYTESYTCPFVKDKENETTAPESIHSASSALELTNRDSSKPEASNSSGPTAKDLISLEDEEKDPETDSTLVPHGDSVDSSHQKGQGLIVQKALVQHLQILGLANTYQVRALADTARGYIANILSHSSSAGPALQLINEMKTTDIFDGQVWDLIYTCVISRIQSPFGHRLLAEAFSLCDAIRTDALLQRGTIERLRSDLAIAHAQLRASVTVHHHAKHDQLTDAKDDLARAQAHIREIHEKLNAATPGLRIMEEIKSAHERMALILRCRNATCCATYTGFKGRVQVDQDLSVTVRCVACFCKH